MSKTYTTNLLSSGKIKYLGSLLAIGLLGIPLLSGCVEDKASAPTNPPSSEVASSTLPDTKSNPPSDTIKDPAPSNDAAVGPESGQISDPVTVQENTPAMTKLDVRLKKALENASRDATQSGIQMRFTSGWRTTGYQQQLFDEVVQKYQSVEVAQKYVAPPEKSAHVTGNAVDVYSTTAIDWLAQRGAEYGLCQIYANEMWHYELRTTEISQTGSCPPLKADASG